MAELHSVHRPESALKAPKGLAPRLTITVAQLLVVITLLGLVFQELIETLLPGSAVSSLDEAILVILFGFAFWIQCVYRSFSVVLLQPLALFAYLFLVSAAFGANRDLFEISVQSLLHVQLFFAFVAVFLIERRYPGVARLGLALVTIGSLIGLTLQIVYPGLFEAFFGSVFSEVGVGRYRFDRFDGVQRNPNALGVLLALACIVWFLRKQYVQSRVGWFLTATLLVLAVALTGSVSAMVILFLGAIFSGAPIRKLAFIGVIGISLLWMTGTSQLLFEKAESTVEYLVEEPVERSRYTRWVMAYYGAELAVTNFPIGTGSATFGSALAHGSDVYQKLGIDRLPAVADRRAQDSNIGSVMGEFGLLGLALFLSSLMFLMYTGAGIRHFSRLQARKRFRICLLMLCIAVFMFIMRPFFNSSYYGMIFTLAFFAAIEPMGQCASSIRSSRSRRINFSVLRSVRRAESYS